PMLNIKWHLDERGIGHVHFSVETTYLPAVLLRRQITPNRTQVRFTLGEHNRDVVVEPVPGIDRCWEIANGANCHTTPPPRYRAALMGVVQTRSVLFVKFEERST